MKISRLFLPISIALLPLSLFAQSNTFPTSGNVGVGTTSPVSALQANGSVYVTSRTVPTSGAGLELFYSSGLSYLLSYDRANSLYKSLAFDATEHVFAINGSEKMRLASNGNVGIGTTSPYGRFEVVGAYTDFSGGLAGTQAIAYVTSTTTGAQDAGATFVLRGRTGNAADYYPFAGFKGAKQTAAGDGDYRGYLGIFTQGSGGAFYERMRVDGSGNVGIGTTSPVSKLEVAGPTGSYSSGIGFTPTGTGARVYRTFIDTSGGFNLDDHSAGATRFSISSAGNVGIGTTSPSHKLAVNGTIRAKEVIVDTGWSDYVFKPDYKMASLSEVEAHIKAHGHLPGVPSEAQVAKEGVSMGEMQSKLLAKIEELTLHQIEQEKRIGAQQNQLAAQQEEIRALKASRP